ncbi:hypothetical protein [Nodosilinea nodulosa]|uniref:hypothetical protein n=1 Tax=Nodosilinea nodulosa TaxID=416001 RepID=UPI0002F9733E|nr:hypothetical protein [Nodosilinea nodulosa]
MSGQTGEKATAVSETTTGQKHASGLSELSNIIDVRIADDKITTSYDKADAGIVSLDIRNDSGRSLNLILLKTDLSADQIPIKAGKIDFSGKTVALSGSLLSNPLPAGGTDSIVSDLDPGNYILMAYAPGNVRAAITQRITVQAPGT